MIHQSPPSDYLDATLRCADFFYAHGDWTGARDSLCIAHRLAPADSSILGALGTMHFRLKAISQAETAFAAAVSRSPNDADLLTQLAMMRVELSEPVSAELLLRRALEINPNHRPALVTLATLLHKGGRPLAAARTYYRLLLGDSENIDVLLAMGHCIVACDHLSTARDIFEHVVALEPDNATARANLAYVLRRLRSESGSKEPAATPDAFGFPA